MKPILGEAQSGISACVAWIALSAGICCFVSNAVAAEIPKAPVPPSPFLPVVYRFADAMLEKGRDSYGPQKTGLFLSALDRARMAPLTNRPPAPVGVLENDRVGAKDGPLVGANPQHDENFLRLLYTLSELSSKPKYREAADGELKWFFQNAPSQVTHLSSWGLRMSWNVMTDEPVPRDGDFARDFFRPWLLWDRCFELGPVASRQFALALWQENAVRTTGSSDSPRRAGICIRTWAVAYARTKDDQFLQAIEAVLERFEKKRSISGLSKADGGAVNLRATSFLSLAIDCDGAAHRLPEPQASRLRAFAAREDEVFCALPHNLKATGGFVTEIDRAAGQSNERPTPLWDARNERMSTAQVALMCVSRYDNTGRVPYRELVIAAADAYLKSMPPDDADLWPLAFGHAISLQVAAWRHTAHPAHLEQARQFASAAVEKFWGDSPLPKASLKSEHYESLTGADTLALALVELHLNILHITAVRCPSNTVDR